jgi:hypothetical protein
MRGQEYNVKREVPSQEIWKRPKERLVLIADDRASIPLKMVNCCERNSIASSLKRNQRTLEIKKARKFKTR